MDLLLKGGKVYRSGSFVEEDIAVSDGVIVDVDSFPSGENSCIMVDCSDKIITPGLADVHIYVLTKRTSKIYCSKFIEQVNNMTPTSLTIF